MKVLHVIDAMGVGGGAEHSLAATLPLLRDRGIDSNVACLIPRVGGLQQQLRDAGFGVEVLDADSWVGWIRALRRKIRSEEPDIVHATLFNSCLVTRFACVGLPIHQINSLVNTSYDPVRLSELKIAPWKLRAMRTVDGLTARHLGGRFHAITEVVAREATDVLKIDKSLITVIPRGRNTEAFGEASAQRRLQVRVGLGIADDTQIVFNMARQDAQKAHVDLIRAFARALEDHPRAVLLIAGREGDATHHVQQALSETGAGDAVRFLGHRTDIADLLAAADLFVYPSRYEGLGGALIEAMAVGVPIIGSDAPAISEVLGHGRYGIIVERGDVEALGEAISALLTNDEQREAMRVLGRERFLERYEISLVIDQTVDLYRETLSR